MLTYIILAVLDHRAAVKVWIAGDRVGEAG